MRLLLLHECECVRRSGWSSVRCFWVIFDIWVLVGLFDYLDGISRDFGDLVGLVRMK